MAHFDATHVTLAMTEPGGPYPRRYRLVLGTRDTAWNPTSTKDVISGPATVDYTQYEDGGVDAVVSLPPQVGPPRPRAVDE